MIQVGKNRGQTSRVNEESSGESSRIFSQQKTPIPGGFCFKSGDHLFCAFFEFAGDLGDHLRLVTLENSLHHVGYQ